MKVLSTIKGMLRAVKGVAGWILAFWFPIAVLIIAAIIIVIVNTGVGQSGKELISGISIPAVVNVAQAAGKPYKIKEIVPNQVLRVTAKEQGNCVEQMSFALRQISEEYGIRSGMHFAEPCVRCEMLVFVEPFQLEKEDSQRHPPWPLF